MNRNVVGSDDLPAEFLKVLADEGELDTVPRNVPRNHRRCVEGRWRAATTERCNGQGAAQEEKSDGVRQLP